MSTPPGAKLKLAIFSDLHLEFQDDPVGFLKSIKVRCDVAILAGDICPIATYNREVYEAIGALAKEVIWVSGNHEYYHGSITNCPERLPNNVDFISADCVEIKNQRFLCGTMWYREEDLLKIPADPRTGKFMKGGREVQFSDFRFIKDLPALVYRENKQFLELLRKNLRDTDVVVSHHLPSPKSTPVQFKDEVDNAFFVCDVEDLILERQPKLWVHGHTHTPMDYCIGDTRVVANPHGYPAERVGREPYAPVVIKI